MIEGDSGLFFKQSRAAWLLKQPFKVRELAEQNGLLQARVSNLIFGRQIDSLAITNLQSQVAALHALYASEQRISSNISDQLKDAKAEAKRQRRQKWMIMAGSGVLLVGAVVLAQ